MGHLRWTLGQVQCTLRSAHGQGQAWIMLGGHCAWRYCTHRSNGLGRILKIICTLTQTDLSIDVCKRMNTNDKRRIDRSRMIGLNKCMQIGTVVMTLEKIWLTSWTMILMDSWIEVVDGGKDIDLWIFTCRNLVWVLRWTVTEYAGSCEMQLVLKCSSLILWQTTRHFKCKNRVFQLMSTYSDFQTDQMTLGCFRTDRLPGNNQRLAQSPAHSAENITIGWKVLKKWKFKKVKVKKSECVLPTQQLT